MLQTDHINQQIPKTREHNTTQEPTQSTSQSGTADQANFNKPKNNTTTTCESMLDIRAQETRVGSSSLSRNRWDCRSLSRICFAVRLELCTTPDEAHESLVHAGLQDSIMQEVLMSSCGTSRHFMRPSLKSHLRDPSGLHKICPAKTLKLPLKYITKKPQSKRFAKIHMQTSCNSSCSPSRRACGPR